MTKAKADNEEPPRFEPAVPKKYVEQGRELKRRQMRVMQVFFHADMRLGHDGLKAQAKEHGIDVTKLVLGEYVVFVNTGEDKVKVYAPGNVVAYMQLPAGRKVDPRIIREIPRAFNATGHLDYDEMLSKVVNDHFAKRLAAQRGLTHVKEEENTSSGNADAGKSTG